MKTDHESDAAFDLQVKLHVLIDFHDGGLVAATVTVVRCGEDRHHIALVSPIVAVHDQLMGTSDPCQVI